jgi:hypothetical protein
MQTPTVPHRQVLIRCSVINRDTVCSVRFVEHEHFRLLHEPVRQQRC